MYFHTIEPQKYSVSPHRNAVAVYICESAVDPAELERLFGDGGEEDHQCKALMIVQVLNGSFRFQVRSREITVAASECFEPPRDFLIPERLMHRFSSALINCALLQSIYPPFEQQIELQMRQQLEVHIEPFTRGLLRRFRELANKFQRTTETVSDDSSIYSVEHNAIDAEIGNDELPKGDKKSGKSVFGRVLGKLKSPLSKIS